MRRHLPVLAVCLLQACATEPDRCVEPEEVPPPAPQVLQGILNGLVQQSPFGYFTYLRAPQGACAVRFTMLCRFRDRPHSATASYPGEDVLQRFETYFQGDGSEDFTRPNVVVRQGYVRTGSGGFSTMHNSPSYSIGRQSDIDCGGVSFLWGGAPGGVALAVRSTHGYSSNPALDRAATTVTDPRQIDFKDPKVFWQVHR